MLERTQFAPVIRDMDADFEVHNSLQQATSTSDSRRDSTRKSKKAYGDTQGTQEDTDSGVNLYRAQDVQTTLAGAAEIRTEDMSELRR